MTKSSTQETIKSKVNQSKGTKFLQFNHVEWLEKFLNCFEMKEKYINDLMSKYLLSTNVSSGGKTQQKTVRHAAVISIRKWQQFLWQRLGRDEHLIDFTAASKWWFLVQAQLSFIEGLLSPETCSGIHTTGPPAKIPPLQNQNVMWSLNET